MEPKSIIIIDDAMMAPQIIKERLEFAFPRCKVRIFKSGEEALAAALNYVPEVVLIDNNLGDGHKMGPELVIPIKAKYPGIKVVGAPLDDSSRLRAAFTEAGADAFCAKETGPHAMVETIKKL